jgi:hypothetical protein
MFGRRRDPLGAMKMSFRYIRFDLFQSLLGPYSQRTRRSRMALFARLMRLTSGQRVLDLGGQPGIWHYVSQPLDITILNLPGRV